MTYSTTLTQKNPYKHMQVQSSMFLKDLKGMQENALQNSMVASQISLQQDSLQSNQVKQLGYGQNSYIDELNSSSNRSSQQHNAPSSLRQSHVQHVSVQPYTIISPNHNVNKSAILQFLQEQQSRSNSQRSSSLSPKIIAQQQQPSNDNNEEKSYFLDKPNNEEQQPLNQSTQQLRQEIGLLSSKVAILKQQNEYYKQVETLNMSKNEKEYQLNLENLRLRNELQELQKQNMNIGECNQMLKQTLSQHQSMVDSLKNDTQQKIPSQVKCTPNQNHQQQEQFLNQSGTSQHQETPKQNYLNSSMLNSQNSMVGSQLGKTHQHFKPTTIQNNVIDVIKKYHHMKQDRLSQQPDFQINEQQRQNPVSIKELTEMNIASDFYFLPAQGTVHTMYTDISYGKYATK